MQAEIWEFVKSLGSVWGSWLTGGVVIAAIQTYEHIKGENLPWRFVMVVVVAAFVAATFIVSREQYRGWVWRL